MKKIYVVGFAFSPSLNAVALIHKTNELNAAGEKRPDWLQGKYNGIGTDVTEAGADLPTEMSRTFKDRTGVDVAVGNWRNFHHIENDSAVVLFYMSVLDAIKWQQIRKTTTEDVRKVNIANLSNVQVVGNLKWLIPMALDKGHVASISADTTDMAGGKVDFFTDLTAWEGWRKEKANHMDAENLIPADKLADVKTTDTLLVVDTAETIEELKSGELLDFFLHIAAMTKSTEQYISALLETTGANLKRKDVLRIINVGVDALAQFPIDVHGGVAAAKVAMSNLYAKIVVPALEKKGEGVENSPQPGITDGGGQKKSEGVENNSQNTGEPIADATPTEDMTNAAGDLNTKDTDNKEGVDPANTPGAEGGTTIVE